ncbi:MAG: hypothetical protein ACKOZY_08675 [Flavobacteriales bacterium]
MKLKMITLMVLITQAWWSSNVNGQSKPEDHVNTPADGDDAKKRALEKKNIEYQQGLEKHQKAQDKKTRKRMKRMERQSRKLGKPLPWYKRWFRRKKRT